MRPQTARRVAPLAVAALVLAVIAVVWGVLRVAGPSGPEVSPGVGSGAGSAAGDPEPLRLVGWSPSTSDVADPRYHLAPGAELPDGPSSAPVRSLAAADIGAAATQTGVPVAADGSPGGPTSGWVQRSSAGPAYPLVTAAKAYAALVRTPLPMPLMACPQPLPEGTDPVPCGGPVTVTGARLGLSVQQVLHQDAAGPLLVPSWLFDLAGSPQPLVALAVEPRLLESVPGSGTVTGGVVSGGAVTGSPGTAAPQGPTTEPGPQQTSRFTSVTRGADVRSIDVTFWGGVPECYSYDVRAAEDRKTVRLTLVERRADGVCVDLAVQVHRTVRLDAPLGRRVVVDAESGQTLVR